MEYKILTPSGKIETVTDYDYKTIPEIMNPVTDRVKELASKDTEVIKLEKEMADITKTLADLNSKHSFPETSDLAELENFSKTHDMDAYLAKAGDYMASIKALNERRTDIIKKYVINEQERIAATYKNDIPTLLNNLYLDISLYAYHIYQVRHDSKKELPKELPEGIRELWEQHKEFELKDVVMYQDEDVAFTVLEFLKAMSKAENFVTYSYKNAFKDLLESPHIKYCGIRPYVEFIERESPEDGKKLRQWITASIKAATAISKEEQAYIEKWVDVAKKLAAKKKKKESPLKGIVENPNDLPKTNIDYVIQVIDSIIPADKVTKRTYDGSIEPDETARVITSRQKAKKEIYTDITLRPPKDMSPLNPFDKRVNMACCSLWTAGNSGQSFATIARTMTGRDNKFTPSKELIRAVIYSCEKQRRTDFKRDSTIEAEAYPGLRGREISIGSLFPGQITMIQFNNGVSAAGFKFDRPPANYEYAMGKKQILSMDEKLLNTGIEKEPENIILETILLEKLTDMNTGAKTRTIVYDGIAKELETQMERFNSYPLNILDKPTKEVKKSEKKTSNSSAIKRRRRMLFIKKINTIIDTWKGRLYTSCEEIKKGRLRYGIRFVIPDKKKRNSKAH